MNIILLSGGSGKRLWPLSNNIRSKQFIKLFKHGNEYESMVQRVYRQITTVDPNMMVTIATSESQVPAIYSQLGKSISVCVEPMRRDTFPAITLASVYLHDKLGVKENESIVVCPVDPYVDSSYYELVKEMGDLAEQANLTLMGIEPTYPSEKYGYIIPKNKNKLSKVKEFKEKPNKVIAEKYLAQGAVWNAGVFAFKLKYLLDKAHELLDFTDYYDLYEKYNNCPNISFDYAVVEKESNINVVRYSGQWKDVGTWNMMSEVMIDKVIGSATLDNMTTNTNVINELEIPILIMGAHDMVVAASRDGILVADKEQSGFMKPYVEKIATDVRYADEFWGSYQVVDNGNNSLTIRITVKAGCQMSYHSHKYRNEIWIVLSGKGKSVIDGVNKIVASGDVVTMPVGCKHTVIAYTDMIILETQIGTAIVKKDKKIFSLSNS